MKNILIFALCIWIAAFFLLAFPTDADAGIYEDTIRLHVIANSDTDADQETKIYVRDRLLEEYGDLIYADTYDRATENAKALLPQITASVNAWLEERGADYGGTATLSYETYDTRDYDGFSMPAGVYLSLRVTLGDGIGKNWWCVMFPPLCRDLSTVEVPMEIYTEEERNLVTDDGYRVKFKILEVTSAIGEKLQKRN